MRCDDPTDCGSGQVCCVYGHTTVWESTCAKPADCPTTDLIGIMCLSDAHCPTGTTFIGWLEDENKKRLDVKAGWCTTPL